MTDTYPGGFSVKHKQLSKSSIDTLDRGPDSGLAENSSSEDTLLNSTIFSCRYAGEELLSANPKSDIEQIFTYYDPKWVGSYG